MLKVDMNTAYVLVNMKMTAKVNCLCCHGPVAAVFGRCPAVHTGQREPWKDVVEEWMYQRKKQPHKGADDGSASLDMSDV